MILNVVQSQQNIQGAVMSTEEGTYYLGSKPIDQSGIRMAPENGEVRGKILTQEFLMTLPEDERREYLNILSSCTGAPWFFIRKGESAPTYTPQRPTQRSEPVVQQEVRTPKEKKVRSAFAPKPFKRS